MTTLGWSTCTHTHTHKPKCQAQKIQAQSQSGKQTHTGQQSFSNWTAHTGHTCVFYQVKLSPQWRWLLISSLTHWSPHGCLCVSDQVFTLSLNNDSCKQHTHTPNCRVWLLTLLASFLHCIHTPFTSKHPHTQREAPQERWDVQCDGIRRKMFADQSWHGNKVEWLRTSHKTASC